MIFDTDRNRAGFETKKKKRTGVYHLNGKALARSVFVMLFGAIIIGSTYALTSDFVSPSSGHQRLVTRSLHETFENSEVVKGHPGSNHIKLQKSTSISSTTTTTLTPSKSTPITSPEKPSTTASTSTKPAETIKIDLIAPDDQNSSQKCINRKNIFFLKTHKAGSTTVQNVLLRYGERNNATFALPKQSAAHVFNYNVKFSPTMVRPSPSGQYNILCNHLHFHEPGVRQLMPKDTKYIAIVRHPIDLFESIMSYYTDDVRAFQRVPGKSIQQRMKNFLDDPKKYYGFDASHYERFAKNAMMWDFGFDNDEEDDEAIDQWIQYLDDTFDLVMITDYFDESMVLLKDELCWDTEDISYLKSNSRKRDQESVRQWLGPEYSQKLLDWNKADWKLYQHFNQTFNKKIEEFGVGRMQREVAKLKEANRNVRDKCLSGDQTTTFFRTVPLTKYRLKDKNDESCQNLIRSERQYLYKINTKQENLMKEQKL